MIDLWNHLNLVLAVALPIAGMAAAAQSLSDPHGIFTDSTDIGKALKGSTVFDPATGSYRVTGGGADMWGSEDAFRLSWVKLTGDATLTADVQFPADVPVPLEKAVLRASCPQLRLTMRCTVTRNGARFQAQAVASARQSTPTR